MTFNLKGKEEQLLKHERAMMSLCSWPDKITGDHFWLNFFSEEYDSFFWSMASFLLTAAPAGESRQAHLAAAEP